MNKTTINAHAPIIVALEIVRCPKCQLPHTFDVYLPPSLHESLDRDTALLEPMKFLCENNGGEFHREIVIDVHYNSLRATDRHAWYSKAKIFGSVSDHRRHVMNVQLGLEEWDPRRSEPSAS